MTGYGSSHYGSEWYFSSPYRHYTELTHRIRARIVKPVTSIPPVMDTISLGLAQRMDYLQQGIQSFSLFNKITYARGESDGFLPSLDDVWGKIYDLPRLTGETDDNYRIRLQVYVKALIGSGTIPATQEVLDFVIGIPGATRITSRWPARVLIDFSSAEAMRAAKARRGLIDSILPGLFAAGVDYGLIIPFLDHYIKTAIRGDAELPAFIRAAVATNNELPCWIGATISYQAELPAYIRAAIQAERDLNPLIRAAIRAERDLEPIIKAAIAGDAELPAYIRAAIMRDRYLEPIIKAAIQGEPELPAYILAAVARNFERKHKIIARIEYSYKLDCYIKAAIQSHQELTHRIRARIAKRMG